MIKTVRVLAATATLAIPLALSQSAVAAMHAKISGVVTKEDMGKHTLTVKTSTGKSFLVYTTGSTKYTHLKTFESLKKGLHVAIVAEIKESDHTYWALSISKM